MEAETEDEVRKEMETLKGLHEMLVGHLDRAGTVTPPQMDLRIPDLIPEEVEMETEINQTGMAILRVISRRKGLFVLRKETMEAERPIADEASLPFLSLT